MDLVLQVEKRDTQGTRACNKLRADGVMPAVMYGKEQENQNIAVSTKEFEKLWHTAGESTMITLSGAGNNTAVLIQNVDLDPLYGTPVHADFYIVNTKEVVSVEVPLVFEGVAPAEKELGGNLVKVMHSLEIEALPAQLPHEIVVDSTALATFDDQILVENITLPEGVTTSVDAKEVVAIVQPPREEEEEPVAEVDLSEVEVEKKGKEESEEESNE